MAIPNFDHHGLLPKGIYDCTMEEIKTRFTWNTRRDELYTKLDSFLNTEIRPDFPDPIYCDGSFVTDKEQPDDTDIVLDLREAPDRRKWRGLYFMTKEQSRIMRQYRVHFWVDLPARNSFSLYFQYVGIKTGQLKGLDPHHNKGILRVP